MSRLGSKRSADQLTRSSMLQSVLNQPARTNGPRAATNAPTRKWDHHSAALSSVTSVCLPLRRLIDPILVDLIDVSYLNQILSRHWSPNNGSEFSMNVRDGETVHTKARASHRISRVQDWQSLKFILHLCRHVSYSVIYIGICLVRAMSSIPKSNSEPRSGPAYGHDWRILLPHQHARLIHICDPVKDNRRSLGWGHQNRLERHKSQS